MDRETHLEWSTRKGPLIRLASDRAAEATREAWAALKAATGVALPELAKRSRAGVMLELERAVRFEKYDGRSKAWKPTNAPDWLVAQMRERLKLVAGGVTELVGLEKLVEVPMEPSLADKVNEAERRFAGRWTPYALAKRNPDLFRRLEQARLGWWEAERTGQEVERYGGVMLRGLETCTKWLEEHGVPEDAYVLGTTKDGSTVAFGWDKASAGRVAERFGPAPFFTFDEAAELLLTGSNRAVSDVLSVFPGAEVVSNKRLV